MIFPFMTLVKVIAAQIVGLLVVVMPVSDCRSGFLAVGLHW